MRDGITRTHLRNLASEPPCTSTRPTYFFGSSSTFFFTSARTALSAGSLTDSKSDGRDLRRGDKRLYWWTRGPDVSFCLIKSAATVLIWPMSIISPVARLMAQMPSCQKSAPGPSPSMTKANFPLRTPSRSVFKAASFRIWDPAGKPRHRALGESTCDMSLVFTRALARLFRFEIFSISFVFGLLSAAFTAALRPW